VLGFGWALLQPVFQIVVISVIFGSFLRIPSGNLPYPIFSYAAILPWTLFSGSISSAVPSIVTNMHLMTKIYFPREILPIAAIFARFIDFGIASLVFIGLMVYYQIPLYSTVVYIPILLLIQTVLAFGLGLLGSAVSVFLRDISFAVPLVMQLWMYATPIIYPVSMVPDEWIGLYRLNPMVGIITSYRRVLLEGQVPQAEDLITASLVSILLFILSYIYFKYLEMNMADII
jgi:lipopolysaccharide transport system permease protein